MQKRHHARVHEVDLGAWKSGGPAGAGRGWGVGWGEGRRRKSGTVVRSSHDPKMGFCRPGVPARASGQ